MGFGELADGSPEMVSGRQWLVVMRFDLFTVRGDVEDISYPDGGGRDGLLEGGGFYLFFTRGLVLKALAGLSDDEVTEGEVAAGRPGGFVSTYVFRTVRIRRYVY